MRARLSASYGLATLASGVYPAQTDPVTRTVNATAAPCFTAANTTVDLGDDVTAVPGVATPLTATVTTGGSPATGVPVSFTVTYTDAKGNTAVKTLGAASTDATGVATYALKAAVTTPSGVLKALIAKSAITPAPIASATSTLSVAASPTVSFDTDSFNINGSTAFTTSGHHDDELITGVASTVAGRLLGDAEGTDVTPVGVPVTLVVTSTSASTGKPVIKRFAGRTDAHGWFRIPVKDPVATGSTGTVTILTARSGPFPALAAIPFTDSTPVYYPELWSPTKNTMVRLAPISVPRNYHSVALLLTDGRVLSAGGGLCNCAADHPNLQILTPPYLYGANGQLASRPTITAAPTSAALGTTITASTDRAIQSFALVRVGSTTHTVDNDQRRVPLTISGSNGTQYNLALPSDPGIVTPGSWMLFALDANGVPSVAKIVRIR